MTRRLMSALTVATLAACTNTVEMESGEIKALKLIKRELDAAGRPAAYFDARKLVTRDMLDAADIPVLFVAIERGQNGTLTQFPGVGVGQTWLGVDGSTVTLAGGILKATRGVGDDLMGSEISREINWKDIDPAPYTRSLAYLQEDNQMRVHDYVCEMSDTGQLQRLEIFDASFTAWLFRETCEGSPGGFTNDYYVDAVGIVRKSRQYHGEKIGYMTLDRLDR